MVVTICADFSQTLRIVLNTAKLLESFVCEDEIPRFHCFNWESRLTKICLKRGNCLNSHSPNVYCRWTIQETKQNLSVINFHIEQKCMGSKKIKNKQNTMFVKHCSHHCQWAQCAHIFTLAWKMAMAPISPRLLYLLFKTNHMAKAILWISFLLVCCGVNWFSYGVENSS